MTFSGEGNGVQYLGIGLELFIVFFGWAMPLRYCKYNIYSATVEHPTEWYCNLQMWPQGLQKAYRNRAEITLVTVDRLSVQSKCANWSLYYSLAHFQACPISLSLIWSFRSNRAHSPEGNALRSHQSLERDGEAASRAHAHVSVDVREANSTNAAGRDQQNYKELLLYRWTKATFI